MFQINSQQFFESYEQEDINAYDSILKAAADLRVKCRSKTHEVAFIVLMEDLIYKCKR